MTFDLAEPTRIRLFLVAPNGDLSENIRTADTRRRFETVRFRSFEKAFQKGKNDASVILIAQWHSQDVPRGIDEFDRLGTHFFSSRFFVYIPDLSTRPSAEGETLRFALQQTGVTAVFSRLRELPPLFSVFQRHVKRAPVPLRTNPGGSNDLYRSLFERLPWQD